jgi:hypothetical protein
MNHVVKQMEDLIAQQAKEIDRLREGWEVIAQLPMSEHPSDTRNFAKRMLKGETPYKLAEGVSP